MIALLRGVIAAVDGQRLVVEVGGLGFEVWVPLSLATQSTVGDTVRLFTHLHVREGEWTLYGFATAEERDLFRLLLNVPGVGPRVALNLLSTLSVGAIQRAVLEEEPALLSRVPGIGRKTAEKIVLELKDKLPREMEVVEVTSPVHAADAEVIEALVALGYSVVEAQRAVQGLPPDVTDVEERLRLALSRLSPV